MLQIRGPFQKTFGAAWNFASAGHGNTVPSSPIARVLQAALVNFVTEIECTHNYVRPSASVSSQPPRELAYSFAALSPSVSFPLLFEFQSSNDF